MDSNEDVKMGSGKLLLLFPGIVLAWAGAWWLISSQISGWQTRGQFGDMFGAVNALFSGLAFAGVIIALVFQRRELELQRKELALTRQELSRAAEAQDKSQSALTKQALILRHTAEVNALASLIQILSGDLDRFGRGRPELNDKLREYEKRLEDLLDRLPPAEQ